MSSNSYQSAVSTWAWPSSTRGMSRRQLLSLLALASGGVMTGCSVNPVTGQRELMLMSSGQELDIDQQHSPHQISADYGRVQDADLAAYVETVGASIGQVSHRPDMPYQYLALNANYVNAYAFPGGTIGVTRGILLSMESEAELAALLGHEVAHVSARHTAQRMTQQTLVGIAVAGAGVALATQVDDTATALALGLGGVAAGALLARYSRSDERQADALGLEYMTAAGYSPEGMVHLMDLLQNLSSRQPSMLEQMFSSHPMSDERYRDAQREAAERYADQADQPFYRERYMDLTADLRRLKPAVALQQQAEAQLGRGAQAEAVAQLEESLKLAPEDYTGLVLLGKAWLAKENFAQAKGPLTEAARVYPEEAQAQHLLGVLALQEQQPEQALNQFKNYQRLLPGNPMTDFFIGLSHEGLAEKPEAAAAYQRFLNQGGSGEPAKHARQQLSLWGAI